MWKIVTNLQTMFLDADNRKQKAYCQFGLLMATEKLKTPCLMEIFENVIPFADFDGENKRDMQNIKHAYIWLHLQWYFDLDAIRSWKVIKFSAAWLLFLGQKWITRKQSIWAKMCVGFDGD